MRSSVYSAGKEFAVYGLGSVATQAVSIVLIPVYTRWLGVTDYGLLSLLLGVQSVLIVLAQCGLGSALFRSFYDYSDERGQRGVISTTFWLLVASSSIVATITFALADHLSAFPGQVDLEPTQLQMIALIVLFEGINILPFSIFRARRQPVRYIATSLVALVVRLVAVIYFVVIEGGGIQGVLYGTLIGAIFSSVVGFGQVISTISLNILPRETKKLLRFGLPLIPANVAGWILAVSGRYLLAYFGTISEVGVYALADRFAGILSVLLVQPLFLLWLPVMLSVHREQHANQFYSRALTYFVMSGLFLSLSLSLFAGEALTIFATPEFAQTRYIVFPLCLSTVVYGASRILNVGTDLARKSENSSYALITAVLAFAISSVTIMPVWPVGGLITSICVAYVVMSAITYLLANRLYQVRYAWKKIASMVIISIVIYGSSVLLDNVIESNMVKISVKLTLLLSFLPIMFFWGIIDQQEKSEVWRQINRAKVALLPHLLP